jgi:phosphohistidine phosphatase SixA
MPDTRGLFLALCAIAASAPAVGTDTWAALQQGGKVILMRHAATERGKNALHHDPRDCAHEARLSAKGRSQATATGQALRERGIVIGEVLASPYCRTMETARLAFGTATASDALFLAEALDAATAGQRNAAALRLVGSHRGPANRVLVTHEPNIVAIALESVEPGGMLVLAPKGGSEFDVLGKLTPSDVAR